MSRVRVPSPALLFVVQKHDETHEDRQRCGGPHVVWHPPNVTSLAAIGVRPVWLRTALATLSDGMIAGDGAGRAEVTPVPAEIGSSDDVPNAASTAHLASLASRHARRAVMQPFPTFHDDPNSEVRSPPEISPLQRAVRRAVTRRREPTSHTSRTDDEPKRTRAGGWQPRTDEGGSPGRTSRPRLHHRSHAA